ncbi:ABC transporter ATP-binding protein [Mesomycoplasma lagogenitalium]|uniref:ABC transporter ATP-binding protein n=1 Tax=Mesomycoplasma lagogenitalium TaxID=171286 RepID=A0ABY8LTR2_9BACT|nr:ABC transporter ATP-binding protein [Mesomycoplasma lagogenitalium]WGI36632.1 ABC transporter ATP-binding protein [Mesomycoplasma lagogenitalium]
MKQKIKIILINKFRFSLLILISAIKSIIFGLSFFSLFKIFNSILNSNEIKEILIYSFLSLLFVIFNVLLNSIYKHFYKKYLNTIINILIKEATDNLETLSVNKFKLKTDEEILYYSTEIPKQISGFFYEIIFLLIEDIMKFIVIITLFFYFNWIIGILVTIMGILLILYYNKTLFLMTKIDYKSIDLEEENRYHLNNFLKLYKYFFLMRKNKLWFILLNLKIKDNHNQIYKNEKKYFKIDALNEFVIALFIIINILIFSLFTFYNLFNFTIDILLIAFILISSWTLNITDIYRSIPAFSLAKELINELDEVKEKEIQTEKSNLYFNELNIRNLNIFINEKNIIKNLNLSLKENEKLAIVGKSGAGKSTLVNLLLNNNVFEQISFNGSIDWNEQNAMEMSNQEIKENFIFVGTENNLLNGTIEENISLFSKQIDSLKLKEICKLLEIDYLNLEIQINTSEFKLSEGEKKRIILARLLYLSSNKIVILDESFNNLNNKMAEKVREIIMENSRIYIEISHNFSDNDYKKFDKVVKL